MFVNSICEYKQRLSYGDNQYRGNTSGGIVSDFLDFAHRNPNGLFVDPMEGSGTSKDVAAARGIRYKGFDLKSGFNITRDDLGTRLGESAASIFCHPPYWRMIEYSKHPDDLSTGTLDEFLQKLQLAMMNVFDALKPGGRYGILMGNWRSKGTYYPLCSLSLTVCPGKLKEEIIKVQNNCTSDSRIYKGAGTSFIPIKHEILYIFEKEFKANMVLDFAIDFSTLLQNLHRNTWINTVKRIFQKEQRELSLQELYELVENNASEKIRHNPNWKAKIRQIVGQHQEVFKRKAPGIYVLSAA